MARGRPMVSVRFDAAEIERLKEMAEETNTSVAALIRKAVKAFMDKERPDQ